MKIAKLFKAKMVSYFFKQTIRHKSNVCVTVAYDKINYTVLTPFVLLKYLENTKSLELKSCSNMLLNKSRGNVDTIRKSDIYLIKSQGMKLNFSIPLRCSVLLLEIMSHTFAHCDVQTEPFSFI